MSASLDKRIEEFTYLYRELVGKAVADLENCASEIKYEYGMADAMQDNYQGKCQILARRLQPVFDGIVKREPVGAGDPTMSLDKMFEAYEGTGVPILKRYGNASNLEQLMVAWKKDDYFKSLVRDILNSKKPEHGRNKGPETP